MRKALNLIEKTNGKFFSINFVKKNGESRFLTGRIGVTKDLTGEGLKYDPIERGLYPVYDIQKKEYRMVNLNTVKSFKTNGKVYFL